MYTLFVINKTVLPYRNCVLKDGIKQYPIDSDVWKIYYLLENLFIHAVVLIRSILNYINIYSKRYLHKRIRL